MVWFQCEDCGDNLKKPKLPNHFRVCSASKLSCIDCGDVFGQETVERHTQCITEAEKYGPKDQGKASSGMTANPKNDSKKKPEVDINVGLSERPPWFCRLCNTKATSKQALLLHADGKKHRAKARGFHAANQKLNDTAEANTYNGNNAETDLVSKDIGEPRDQKLENNDLESSKKRKLYASDKDVRQGGGTKSELSNGEHLQINGAETDVTKSPKKAKHDKTQEDTKMDSIPDKDSGKKKLKWKKLITSALRSKPDGKLKFKELKKVVAKSLKESGYAEDENQVPEMLLQKINSSSRFVINGKYVSLATNG